MTPLQREALAELSEAWNLSPYVRLSQLMAHLGFLGEAQIGKGLGDIEDEELLAILKHHRTELRNCLEATPGEAPQRVGEPVP